MFNGDWLSSQTYHQCTPAGDCRSTDDTVESATAALCHALLARLPQPLAMSKWTTVQDNMQWWTLFFCHNLIGRAWVEEFAAEADAADSSDTDDEDDWRALMGKRKNTTVLSECRQHDIFGPAVLFDSAIGRVAAILSVSGTQGRH